MTRPSANICQEDQTQKQKQSIDYLPALFLLAAICFMPIGSESSMLNSPKLNSLAIVFISIVLEAIPFMFVGSLIGGLIETFVSRERMIKFLPKRGWLTVCIAAGAGIVFPVCECAIVPVVRRLLGKGLPVSAAIGYLLGGPIVNPVVAASTALAYAFDWRIVALRMILGYGIAVFVGILIGRFFSKDAYFKEQTQGIDEFSSTFDCAHHHIDLAQASGCSVKAADFQTIHDSTSIAAGECGCSHMTKTNGWLDKVGSAFRHAVDDFLAVGHYLVIGAFIAALAQTYIERASFLKVAETPVLSVVLMMALAFLLNLCSEADAFIAASFRGFMPLPAQMAFMLTGPILDLKLLMMYQSIFQRKVIIVLAALISIAILGISFGLLWINGVTS